jgi:hypothetical protein
MNKTERAYLERAWKRNQRLDPKADRESFIAGWRAALRASDKHNHRNERRSASNERHGGEK